MLCNAAAFPAAHPNSQRWPFHFVRHDSDMIPTGIRDCTDALKAGSRHNAVYWIDPLGHGPFQVFCDQTTDGGGWTVLQRRQDGAIDFYRNWTEYSNGFGHLTGEFWLGLDKMHKLTTASNSTLRIELEDWGGQKANATYDFFRVSAEFDNYTLDIGNYSAGNQTLFLLVLYVQLPFRFFVGYFQCWSRFHTTVVSCAYTADTEI